MIKEQLAQENHQDIQNEVSWTPEEIKKLRDGGFIPSELFEPSKSKELAEYLRFNHNNLREHCYPNYDKFPFAACVPPQNEWSDAPDLKIIDRRTGQVVQVLEMGLDFELCEGVYLKIKAKEFPEWDKETSEAKKLNKEQSEDLKTFLNECGKDRPLTRKEIVTFIEEIQKSKQTKKYRQSGHLTDQTLKYQYPKDNQMTIFDIISPETKEKIEESKIEIKAEGIRLTPEHDKMIKTLNKLLYEKSENKDIESEQYYAGNEALNYELVSYGGNGQMAKPPYLRISPAELYKSYLGRNHYSAEEMKHVKKVLRELSEKKYLIIYDRKRKVKNKTVTDRIEDFQSLIKIIKFYEGLTETELKHLNDGSEEIKEKRSEIIIALNPIFRDQIDTKYIEIPVDINRRTIIAAGNHHSAVTESAIILRDYMLRELSAERYNPPINEDKLPYLLRLEKYIKAGRKKLIKERIEGAINLCKNLGLIIAYEIVIGSEGQRKYIFTLNKDFE